MEKILCPKHRTEMRHVPSGISKTTSKPYKEFWSCPVKEEEGWCKENWRPLSKQDLQHKEVMDMLKKILEKIEGVEEPPEMPEIDDEDIPVLEE